MFSDQLYSMAAESDARVTLNIKKVAASQVGVAVRFAGPKGRGVDHNLDRRGLGMGRIKVKGAVDILEVPSYIRHHHVPRTKFCGRVARFKSPSRHVFSLSFIMSYVSRKPEILFCTI